MARVLVVDDEPQVLGALRRLLRRAGFEVETANSGFEALEKLQAFIPDIVLSDFRMPKMTGPELLAQVKERCPTALRIIISGHAEFDSVVASVNEGEICRFITKPWDDERLVTVLQQLLREQSLLSTMRRSFEDASNVRFAGAVHQESTVELRLQKSDSFSVEKAVEVLQAFAGVLEQQKLAVVSGLLQNHGGVITFTARVGGDERLSLRLPADAAGALAAAS